MCVWVGSVVCAGRPVGRSFDDEPAAAASSRRGRALSKCARRPNPQSRPPNCVQQPADRSIDQSIDRSVDQKRRRVHPANGPPDRTAQHDGRPPHNTRPGPLPPLLPAPLLLPCRPALPVWFGKKGSSDPPPSGYARTTTKVGGAPILRPCSKNSRRLHAPTTECCCKENTTHPHQSSKSGGGHVVWLRAKGTGAVATAVSVVTRALAPCAFHGRKKHKGVVAWLLVMMRGGRASSSKRSAREGEPSRSTDDAPAGLPKTARGRPSLNCAWGSIDRSIDPWRLLCVVSCVCAMRKGSQGR